MVNDKWLMPLGRRNYFTEFHRGFFSVFSVPSQCSLCKKICVNLFNLRHLCAKIIMPINLIR
jgi:hypothetical protein